MSDQTVKAEHTHEMVVVHEIGLHRKEKCACGVWRIRVWAAGGWR